MLIALGGASCASLAAALADALAELLALDLDGLVVADCLVILVK